MAENLEYRLVALLVETMAALKVVKMGGVMAHWMVDAKVAELEGQWAD